MRPDRPQADQGEIERPFHRSGCVNETELRLEGTDLDEAVARDLAVARMDHLVMYGCPGLSPAVVAELARNSAIRSLFMRGCECAGEELNRLWSGLPNLERASMDDNRIEGDG